MTEVVGQNTTAPSVKKDWKQLGFLYNDKGEHKEYHPNAFAPQSPEPDESDTAPLFPLTDIIFP